MERTVSDANRGSSARLLSDAAGRAELRIANLYVDHNWSPQSDCAKASVETQFADLVEAHGGN